MSGYYWALIGHLVTEDGTCTRPECRGRHHPYVVPASAPVGALAGPTVAPVRAPDPTPAP